MVTLDDGAPSAYRQGGRTTGSPAIFTFPISFSTVLSTSAVLEISDKSLTGCASPYVTSTNTEGNILIDRSSSGTVSFPVRSFFIGI